MEWKKICIYHISVNELISKTSKELIQFNRKKQQQTNKQTKKTDLK